MLLKVLHVNNNPLLKILMWQNALQITIHLNIYAYKISMIPSLEMLLMI